MQTLVFYSFKNTLTAMKNPSPNYEYFHAFSAVRYHGRNSYCITTRVEALNIGWVFGISLENATENVSKILNL